MPPRPETDRHCGACGPCSAGSPGPRPTAQQAQPPGPGHRRAGRAPPARRSRTRVVSSRAYRGRRGTGARPPCSLRPCSVARPFIARRCHERGGAVPWLPTGDVRGLAVQPGQDDCAESGVVAAAADERCKLLLERRLDGRTNVLSAAADLRSARSQPRRTVALAWTCLLSGSRRGWFTRRSRRLQVSTILATRPPKTKSRQSQVLFPGRSILVAPQLALPAQSP